MIIIKVIMMTVAKMKTVGKGKALAAREEEEDEAVLDDATSTPLLVQVPTPAMAHHVHQHLLIHHHLLIRHHLLILLPQGRLPHLRLHHQHLQVKKLKMLPPITPTLSHNRKSFHLIDEHLRILKPLMTARSD